MHPRPGDAILSDVPVVGLRGWRTSIDFMIHLLVLGDHLGALTLVGTTEIHVQGSAPSADLVQMLPGSLKRAKAVIVGLVQSWAQMLGRSPEERGTMSQPVDAGVGPCSAWLHHDDCRRSSPSELGSGASRQ